MSIQQPVLDAIMSLEDAVHTQWINRALILCPDGEQCHLASKMLSDMDYMVETITQDDMSSKNYERAIGRLRNGLSRVLVTVPAVFKIIQELGISPLYFDIIL